jgi:phytoene dehydrogenase-like protein
MPDAVVIGAGPNGLVAANLMADAGWDVLVVEANDEPGGAVRTAEVTAPGFRNDLFSAFYPLGAASPVIDGLGLAAHGLRWVQAPLVLAHPLPDGGAAVLSRDLDVTAAGLDGLAPGDGDAWRDLYRSWERTGPALLGALTSPMPPVRSGARLARAVGARDLMRFARFGLLPVRRMGEEWFRGEGGPLLLAGNALHTDLSPEAAGSGLFGWMLAMLGQQVGFPVPEGGAGRLTDALVSRLAAAGGRVVCGARVVGVRVEGGRAIGVRTEAGDDIDAHRAVLADCDVISLYRRLVGPEHLPPRLLADLDRFQPGAATVKVDWALAAPIPWTSPDARRAGTLHLAGSLDELSATSAQLAAGLVPDRPFLICGQMTTADPTRSPPGTEAAWAYTHVPQAVKGDAGEAGIKGAWDHSDTARFVERLEARVEALAPGFRDRVIARHVFTPPALQAADANLVGGDVLGGTAALHQQLAFRPTPGLGRAETPVRGLYLASASAHPGGGVHGACGANAARAALFHDRRPGWLVAVAGTAAAGALGAARGRRGRAVRSGR